MTLYDRARLVARCLALAPAFLIGLPVQALLIRTGSRWQASAPVLFHRYVARVIGLNIRVVTPLPPRGAMLILSNHVSWLDIIVLGALVPVSFVAKSEVAGWPGAGLLARLQRTLFVDRNSRRAAALTAAEMAARLAAGDAVVLFAEGTTSDGNRVLPFRSSLVGAVTGSDADVPVQPVAIVYTGMSGLPAGRRERPAIAWYGDMDLAPHLAALLSGGPVDVAVGFAPLPVGRARARKDIAREAEQAVRTLSAAIRSGAGFDAPVKAP